MSKKKAKVSKSGMSDAAKAEWRASKSAQLGGRLAAMKKVAAMPDPKARAPKRSYEAPADADAAGANVGEPVASAATAPGEGDAPAATPDNNHPGKPRERKRAEKPAKAKAPKEPRKDGCLTIAARLLAESKEPLGTKALIEEMAAKGLWTSPGGKTPAATLYAAIVREIGTKGKDARFRKAERGLFAANAANA